MTKLIRHSGFTIVIASAFLTGVSAGQDGGPELETEQQKQFYYMGTIFGASLTPLQLSDAEIELVLRGASDAARGNAVELDAAIYSPRLLKLGEERREALLAAELPKANEYLNRMASEDGAQQLDSGLIFLSLEAGNGEAPAAESVVRLNYRGMLQDGTVFDSSADRGGSIVVPLDKGMPCWQEGVALMQVGGKARLTCPAKLAYKDQGAGIVPPGAAVSFEVELIEIVE